MSMEDLPHGLDLLPWLRARLTTLSDAKFVAVMEALGIISELPAVEGLIHEARPRLRVLRPQRPRSLKRPLCSPLEDLLAIASAGGPGLSVVDRGIVDPLWRHIESHERVALTPLKTEFRRTPANRPQQLLDIGERLWQCAAKVLDKAPIPGIPEERSVLIRDILAVASVIEAFKRAVPRKPIPNLGDHESELMNEQLHILAERGLPKRGFLLVVAARLEFPAQLFTWLRERGEMVPPVVEQFIVGRLSGEIARFDHDADTLAPDALAIAANDLSQTLAAMEKSLGPSSRRELAARSTGLDERMRDALRTRVIDPATEGITAALNDDVSSETLRAAENHAFALAVSRKTAGTLGMSEAADRAVSSIRRACLDRIDEMFRRGSAGTKLDRDQAETAIFRSVRLIELVEGVSAAREIMTEARRRFGVAASQGKI